eukprot:359660-Chlamydomonas_euryale.AAC.4
MACRRVQDVPLLALGWQTCGTSFLPAAEARLLAGVASETCSEAAWDVALNTTLQGPATQRCPPLQAVRMQRCKLHRQCEPSCWGWVLLCLRGQAAARCSPQPTERTTAALGWLHTSKGIDSALARKRGHARRLGVGPTSARTHTRQACPCAPEQHARAQAC